MKSELRQLIEKAEQERANIYINPEMYFKLMELCRKDDDELNTRYLINQNFIAPYGVKVVVDKLLPHDEYHILTSKQYQEKFQRPS